MHMYRCVLIYCKTLATWIYRLNFTNIGSEVYNVCAGLELNSVDMKVGVGFAGSDVVNS